MSQRVVMQAVRDLRAAGLQPPGFVNIDHTRVHVKGNDLGVCYLGGQRGAVIWVSPDLKGAALYRVVLHEFGHVLGLGHTRSKGVMYRKRCQPGDYQTSPPSKRQRKAWVFEIAELVLRHRRKGF